MRRCGESFRSAKVAVGAACGAALGLAAITQAQTVRVVVTGEVESNGFTTGTYAGVPSGAPVTMTIDLDATNFLDSAALPGRTRGYRFFADTFSLQIGAVATTLTPSAVGFFVVRNDDPRVDGFFISQGTDIDTMVPLAMTPTNFGIAFSRTFNNPLPPPALDPTLPSVDILDAVGSWGFENISSYNFTVERNENITPMILAYQTITISVLSSCAPCAADYDEDGGVTGADLAAFFADFEAGAACADVDEDGGVTGGDIGAFFAAYEAGGC